MPSSSSSPSNSSRTIDIFGRQSSLSRGQRGPRGLQGPRGLRGPPGIGSIENIVRWFPNMVVNETRYNEFCCLKIDDPRTDLLVEKGTKVIKRWNSTTSKSNNYAECLQDYFSKTYRLVNARKRIYALDVDGENVYRIRGVTLFPFQTNTWIWACITFRCSKKDKGGGEQYLFSNYDDEKSGDPNEFRGVSIGADQKSIKIWGAAAAAAVTSGGVTNPPPPPNQRFVNVDVTNIPGVDSLLDKWCTVYVFWSDLEVEEATTTPPPPGGLHHDDDGKEGSYVVVVQQEEEEEEEQKRIEGRFTCQACTTLFVPNFIDLFGVTTTTTTTSSTEDENDNVVVDVGGGEKKKKKKNNDVNDVDDVGGVGRRKIIHHGFGGEVAFFELYIQNDVVKATTTTGTGYYRYPEILRDLVIRNQSIYNNNNY